MVSTVQNAIDAYKADIVAFAEAEYILPDTGKPIVLLEHQKRILRDVFTRGADGRFPYTNIIYSCPKKSGKTEIGGLVAEWFALTEGPYNEVYTPANDEEQSQGRVFKAVARSIQANPRLGGVDVNKGVITFPNGTEIRALASDYAGIAGANPGLTIWDELWAYRTENARRLYDELTPVPTRKNSMRFIVSYAGIEGESTLLEELYNQGMSGKRLYDDLPVWVNGSLYMYWDTEARMPWQTPEYYEVAKQDLRHRPNSYRRMHLNEWAGSEDTAIDAEVWDGCVSPELKPILPDRERRVHVGVDAATKRDNAAVVGVYRDGNRFRLAFHRMWVPRPGKPINLNKTVSPYLEYIHKEFRVREIRFDPYQMVSIADDLRDKGLKIVEFPQTTDNLTEATTNLLDLLNTQGISMYPARDLREHALNAVVSENSRGGLKFDKKKTSRKIDAVVALSFAALSATEGGGGRPPRVTFV